MRDRSSIQKWQLTSSTRFFFEKRQTKMLRRLVRLNSKSDPNLASSFIRGTDGQVCRVMAVTRDISKKSQGSVACSLAHSRNIRKENIQQMPEAPEQMRSW